MNLLTFVVVLIGWVFSLCLHEFSHALVAYYGGDTTVKEKGYLTFNPLKYTHPVYSLLLPLLALGLRFRFLDALARRFFRGDHDLLSPGARLAQEDFGLLLRFGPVTSSGVWPGLAFLAFLQVSALILNLIPLPPFDGFGVIEPYLPMNIRTSLAQTRGMLAWAVFFLLWYVPAFNSLFWGSISFLAQLAGVPLQLVALGYNLFRFWG